MPLDTPTADSPPAAGDSLDTPTADSPPAAYFPSVGDSIAVGIVDVGEYHQKDYDTGKYKYWENGEKVMGKVVTGLVVATEGDTAAGSVQAHSPIGAGDLVTFWCEGGKHFTYKDALNAAGGVGVGDVMLWKREADEPAKSSKHFPRKVYTAKIRRPEAKDGDLADRCRAARNELRQVTVDTAPTETVGEAVGDEAPF